MEKKKYPAVRLSNETYIEVKRMALDRDITFIKMMEKIVEHYKQTAK